MGPPSNLATDTLFSMIKRNMVHPHVKIPPFPAISRTKTVSHLSIHCGTCGVHCVSLVFWVASISDSDEINETTKKSPRQSHRPQLKGLFQWLPSTRIVRFISHQWKNGEKTHQNKLDQLPTTDHFCLGVAWWFQGWLVSGWFGTLLSMLFFSPFWQRHVFRFEQIKPTLPETNSSHLKMDGWNTIVSFWDDLFAGVFARVHN